MDSRLLASLNAQASSTRDPVVWARAVCRAASYFARHGKTKEALTSISVVRAHFGKELHHEVASWLMLAEGVLHFFQSEQKAAYDRIRRAYGLAVALKTESVLPICAAWMAHLEFIDDKYEEAFVHIEEALNIASPTDHQAIARGSLTMALNLHFAGDYILARPWYENARLNAVAEGDEAMLAAMLYNVAVIRANNVRLEDTFGIESSKEAHRAQMETSSSVNFDFAIDSQPQRPWSHMLQGLVLTISKKFDEALIEFDLINQDTLMARRLSLVNADKAWCIANLGLIDNAWNLAQLAIRDLSHVAQADDLAYIESRISQTAELCGRPADAALHRAAAEKHLAEHRKLQAWLLGKLQSIQLHGPKTP